MAKEFIFQRYIEAPGIPLYPMQRNCGTDLVAETGQTDGVCDTADPEVPLFDSDKMP